MMRAVRLQQADGIVEPQPFADAQAQLAFALQVLVNQEGFPTRIVLGRGDAPARSVGEGKFGGAAQARGGWRRNLGLDQCSRRLAQNAGRLAVSGVIDLAAFRSLRLRGNSSRFQRRCVGYGDVSIPPDEHSRMPAAHRVDILAGRQLSVGPQRLVPAAANEPLAGRGSLGAGRDALLHLLQRARAPQIHAKGLQARMFQMNVGIVESWHYKVATKVDNLRVGALQLADSIIRPDCENAAIAYRHRLRARWRRLGVEVAVDED